MCKKNLMKLASAGVAIVFLSEEEDGWLNYDAVESAVTCPICKSYVDSIKNEP